MQRQIGRAARHCSPPLCCAPHGDTGNEAWQGAEIIVGAQPWRAPAGSASVAPASTLSLSLKACRSALHHRDHGGAFSGRHRLAAGKRLENRELGTLNALTCQLNCAEALPTCRRAKSELRGDRRRRRRAMVKNQSVKNFVAARIFSVLSNVSPRRAKSNSSCAEPMAAARRATDLKEVSATLSKIAAGASGPVDNQIGGIAAQQEKRGARRSSRPITQLKYSLYTNRARPTSCAQRAAWRMKSKSARRHSSRELYFAINACWRAWPSKSARPGLRGDRAARRRRGNGSRLLRISSSRRAKRPFRFNKIKQWRGTRRESHQ